MSRYENADAPSTRGKRPLSKGAVVSATSTGSGLLGVAGYMANRDPYYLGFYVGVLCLGASLTGILWGLVAVDSPEIRSGAVRGRPLAILGIVLGPIAMLMSCWLMDTNFL